MFEILNKLSNKSPKIKLWGKTTNGLHVWLVDGSSVRRNLFIDYTEGGHDLVYKWIPKNEVWIENQEDEQEREFFLVHELHERHLMDKGMDYERAHADASKVEHNVRRHPEKLAETLSKEGWDKPVE
jgi:hypothetical protein